MAIALIVNTEDSFCVTQQNSPEQKNLFLLCKLLAATGIFGLSTGFVSLDQEKAFDQVNHDLLFHTLEAFSLVHIFTSTIQLL